ncbi:MAG: prepilin-type N-terminal cleavage/methylation domain-containing protein [Opitutales bacterium]
MFGLPCHRGRAGTLPRPPSLLGFTLLELLTVIAIIAILVSITFGIARGVKQHMAVQQARAELAVQTQSLEEHFRRSGDYPHTEEVLANRRDPWGQPYHYYYFSVGGRLGYVLYSAGPDGLHDEPVSLTERHETDPRNQDNIYAEN